MDYTTIQGDTWDLIAHKVYGNDRLGHEILRANSEHNQTAIFPSGVLLNVPELSADIVSDTLPPWK